MVFSETANGFQLSIVSEENETATLLFEYEKQIASKPENVETNIRQQLSKLGNSIYELQHLEIKLENAWFFPASVLSEWRRQAIEKLDALRADAGLTAHGSSLVVLNGDPIGRIIEQEQEQDCDLIVMGKHGESPIEDLLLGSVTKHVLAESLADILVSV